MQHEAPLITCSTFGERPTCHYLSYCNDRNASFIFKEPREFLLFNKDSDLEDCDSNVPMICWSMP
eukprot:scaffold4590_cov112-Cylindrotheca_fusiformis.AAC.5